MLKQYKQLQVYEEGIAYKRKHYAFNEIQHIYFEYIRLIERNQLFIKEGEPEVATLALTMTDGSNLKVSLDERTLFIGWYKNRKDDIKNLIDVYTYLSRVTFESRLLYYENQLRHHGYFQLDECRFYPPDRVLFRDEVFHLNSTRFLLGQGGIRLQRKNSGWKDKLKRELWSGVPAISTLTDRDVVFYLLEKYFGVRWESRRRD